MSLLSAADKREIRDAIKLTTDTFMVSPVLYYRSIGSIDRFEEDSANETFESIEMKVLEEYPSNVGNEVVESLEGSIDFNDVVLTLNLEDAQELGIINTDYSNTLNPEADYFKLKRRIYEVTDVVYDGPLSEKPALLIIKGKLSDTAKTFE